MRKKFNQMHAVDAGYNKSKPVTDAFDKWNRKFDRYLFLHGLVIAPIDAIFNAKKQEINEWADTEIAKINFLEKQGIINLTEVINEFAIAFCKGETYQYTYQDGNQSEICPVTINPDFEQCYEHRWKASCGIDIKSYDEFFNKLTDFRDQFQYS